MDASTEAMDKTIEAGFPSRVDKGTDLQTKCKQLHKDLGSVFTEVGAAVAFYGSERELRLVFKSLDVQEQSQRLIGSTLRLHQAVNTWTAGESFFDFCKTVFVKDSSPSESVDQQFRNSFNTAATLSGPLPLFETPSQRLNYARSAIEQMNMGYLQPTETNATYSADSKLIKKLQTDCFPPRMERHQDRSWQQSHRKYDRGHGSGYRSNRDESGDHQGGKDGSNHGSKHVTRPLPTRKSGDRGGHRHQDGEKPNSSRKSGDGHYRRPRREHSTSRPSR